LLFQHGGNGGGIADFSWNLMDRNMLCSVDDEGSLQIWQNSGSFDYLIDYAVSDDIVLEATREAFGFSIDDQVTWEGADEDVPRGAVGTIVGFTSHGVKVQFRNGSWALPAAELLKATDVVCALSEPGPLPLQKRPRLEATAITEQQGTDPEV
jgi:hypothetical protein